MSWQQDDSDDRLFTAERVDLVAIDLDGTLLRSDGSICFQAAEAIMEATEKGVKVVLSSGRTRYSYTACRLSSATSMPWIVVVESEASRCASLAIFLPGLLRRLTLVVLVCYALFAAITVYQMVTSNLLLG